MTIRFTIFDSNNDTRTSIEAADRVEALRLTAEAMLARLDHAPTVARLRTCIADGCIFEEGHKAPEMILLAKRPERFWTTVAAAASTDNVDFFEGDVAPWEEEA